MIVLHGVWLEGELYVWGEDGSVAVEKRRSRQHPFACSGEQLHSLLMLDEISDATIDMELPITDGVPVSSPSLHRGEGKSRQSKIWAIPAVVLEPSLAATWLRKVTTADNAFHIGDSLRFLAVTVEFAFELMARGRIVPTLESLDDGNSGFVALWRPLLLAEDLPRIQALYAATPGMCMSTDGNVVREVIENVIDATARISLATEFTSIRPRSAREAWLQALVAGDPVVDPSIEGLEKLQLQLDEWRSSAISAARGARTCFRLMPPQSDDGEWLVELLLQAVDDPSLLVDATAVWDGDAVEALSQKVENPRELLLRDLGRASRLYPVVERSLEQARPVALSLNNAEAVEFLQDAAPLLSQAGFGMLLPSWWGSKRARLNAKLKAKSASKSPRSVSSGLFGLESLCQYKWEVALGDDKLSVKELMELARLKQPLVRIRGQWVHLNEQDLAAALEIAKAKDSPQTMSAASVLRVGLGLENGGIGLPVTDVQATGWLGDLLSADESKIEDPLMPEPFNATLRPYQERGLSWMQFHQRLGLGACLADDMGLGKTAQLLAVVAAERNKTSRKKPTLGPTLVVCPMSLVGNWQREAQRFAPQLNVHVHHGSGRVAGKAFIKTVGTSDLVLTTYALATRDQQLLSKIDWHRVVLDEAQNIKNPEARQTKAIRSLPSRHRIALTGTPVENRLTELWSIMEFLNPGLLGSQATFRKCFANPIERDMDNDVASTLRKMTAPFILRRLKTDRSIISDLPEKLEMKTFCNLTREQASLYQATVDDMMDRVENSEGIERKGLVLATMLKLKQVCNHPAQLLSDGSSIAGRSGKLLRLEELIDEIRSEGERVLVFTQFSEMGTMLQTHLQQQFDCDVAWLHGGVSKVKRDKMVEQFQAGEGPEIFLLSLKAGGTGLTLTAANHVIHFDRWWNPAVENQATDRAFRIGQKRNVQVRKFVTVGTLEERIDQMIEQKAALAERVVGKSENWITELSTEDLRSVIALSSDAVAEG